jgi:hypothetical protein
VPAESVAARLRRRPVRAALGAIGVVWLLGMVYGVVKPLPPGTSVAGAYRPADVDFLVDLTYRDGDSAVVEQEVFPAVFDLIDEARQFVVIDMFLFNGEHGGDRDYVPLTEDLVERIVAKRREQPDVSITFITAEINTFYGAYDSPDLSALEDAGVDVVITRLTRMRDSNPLFSGVWRPFVQWFGSRGNGVVPHPLSSTGRQVTVRSYLRLLNFKANHRKVIVTDQGCIVSSANPHTASSLHSNIAWRVRGSLCGDVLEGERAVAAFSGHHIDVWASYPDAAGAPRGRYVTEGKIGWAVTRAIDGAVAGDSVALAMFYLADRPVVRALRRAAVRGAHVTLILDPNRDAFGREKGGVPNRQVAHELVEKTGGRVQVRWYDTHGEQFHSKLVVVRSADSLRVIGGSANLTRRNIRDLNIEANLEFVVGVGDPLAQRVSAYLDRLWSNTAGHFTTDYDAYRDPSFLKRLQYRIQEFSGLSSF